MRPLLLLLLLFAFSCQQRESKALVSSASALRAEQEVPFLVVLGTTQDAGSPQAGCFRKCCKSLYDNPDPSRKVVSLGVIDPTYQKAFLFEATPDLPAQLAVLNAHSKFPDFLPNGIFLTHAHIGHYTGLMHLGKEAINADSVLVFAMPKMTSFLRSNGPWNQLVKNRNIELQPLENQKELVLSPNLKIVPFLVPHRDEYSETVGYKIIGPSKTVLFIPDIDKWSVWETQITKAVAEVDYALLDATFFDEAEVNHRNISEIPHPFVVETMSAFRESPLKEKNKIHFIHFNHTNPLLDPQSEAGRQLTSEGYHIAKFNQRLNL